MELRRAICNELELLAPLGECDRVGGPVAVLLAEVYPHLDWLPRVDLVPATWTPVVVLELSVTGVALATAVAGLVVAVGWVGAVVRRRAP